MIEAIEWAERETAREGGPFHRRIDVTRIAVGGHSCGGLQALAVSHDPRIDTTLVLTRLHAPALSLTGGPSDVAHPNATEMWRGSIGCQCSSARCRSGMGGTFSAPDGGEWAKVTARWLGWQLKADADASWDFAGKDCRLCTDPRWTVVQKQLPPPTGPLR